MNRTRLNRLAVRLISPYGLALVSYCLFLSAILCPPHFYSSVMDEPDYMFLDPASVLFFTLCTLSFLAGVWLIGVVFPVTAFVDRPIRAKVNPILFLLLPLLPLLAFELLSDLLVLRNNPDLLFMLSSQGGNDIKEGLDTQSTFGLAGIYLLGVVWWVSWRCDELGLKGSQRRIVKVAQYLAAAFLILSATLKLARGELMPVITGIAIIYIARKIVRRQAGTRFALKAGLGFAVAVTALFILISFVRGTSDPDQFLSDSVAYTTSSYNRMAALISGRLQYPYAGRGIYLFSFVGFNNMLNAVIPFREFLSWPSFYDWWQSEFQSTWRAGLNGFSIWVSAFGYVFAEMGWWAPVFVFLQGLFCGATWQAVKSGRVAGIVLYPWVAFCILFWFGTNYLLDNKFVVLAIDAVALLVYESLMTVKPITQAT